MILWDKRLPCRRSGWSTPSPACPSVGITAFTEGPAVGAELAWGGGAGEAVWGYLAWTLQGK